MLGSGNWIAHIVHAIDETYEPVVLAGIAHGPGHVERQASAEGSFGRVVPRRRD